MYSFPIGNKGAKLDVTDVTDGGIETFGSV